MKERILVIDDDEIFCEVLAGALRSRGFIVETANNFLRAEQITKKFYPDKAVVDLRIGEDSGLKVCEFLLAEIPEISIVILTGYASIATAVESIKLGVKHYLTKPTDVDSILAALNIEQADTDIPIPEKPLPVKRLEWEHLQKVLLENDGNISKAAEQLNMHRRTLQRKLQKKPVKENKE